LAVRQHRNDTKITQTVYCRLIFKAKTMIVVGIGTRPRHLHVLCSYRSISRITNHHP